MIASGCLVLLVGLSLLLDVVHLNIPGVSTRALGALLAFGGAAAILYSLVVNLSARSDAPPTESTDE